MITKTRKGKREQRKENGEASDKKETERKIVEKRENNLRKKRTIEKLDQKKKGNKKRKNVTNCQNC
jgi:hypothetical protein